MFTSASVKLLLPPRQSRGLSQQSRGDRAGAPNPRVTEDLSRTGHTPALEPGGLSNPCCHPERPDGFYRGAKDLHFLSVRGKTNCGFLPSVACPAEEMDVGLDGARPYRPEAFPQAGAFRSRALTIVVASRLERQP